MNPSNLRNAWAVRAGLCGLVASAGGCGGSAGGLTATPVVISTATRTPRTTTWSVNYWQWVPAFGDEITGTDTLVAALEPGVMRIGGYNNDANTPQPFDNAQLDKAVAYARAIGAEPLLQVPLLADTGGQPPTPATAAAMVTYANITMGYGIKYFSVGNEPDLYSNQGSLIDATMPAIPGYTPAAFCASVSDYVAAMKAVDPTIQIVGPELSWKYQAGNDWLTPILTDCGDLFDIVSIHRYPFEAKQANLAAAEADPTTFRQLIASVRGILQSTGTAKPLAITEMNVAYDATTCVLGASPGTVGSALWLADSVGAAIELGLWTSAIWDIADPDGWMLGLIGQPPAHTPRPEYYAYALFADHFGPTQLGVTSAPAGVHVYASRNQADDTTAVVAINWNTEPAALSFQVTDLAKAPGTATFVLPATSIAAVEIPDTGTAKAWSYGEAQRRTASGPQAITAGNRIGGGTDAGAEAGVGAGAAVGTGCPSADAGPSCPEIVASSPIITSMGIASTDGLSFGSGANSWKSFAYATANPTVPTATLTADGNGIQIAAASLSPGDYEGVGVDYNSSSCLNAAAYTGVKFDFAGTLGSCLLKVGITFSGDDPPADDPGRGACTAPAASCYGPIANVTAAALAATPAAPTVKVSFASMSNGSPRVSADPSKITFLQWQVITGTAAGADGGGACTANFSVENVAFY